MPEDERIVATEDSMDIVDDDADLGEPMWNEDEDEDEDDAAADDTPKAKPTIRVTTNGK